MSLRQPADVTRDHERMPSIAKLQRLRITDPPMSAEEMREAALPVRRFDRQIREAQRLSDSTRRDFRDD